MIPAVEAVVTGEFPSRSMCIPPGPLYCFFKRGLQSITIILQLEAVTFLSWLEFFFMKGDLGGGNRDNMLFGNAIIFEGN